VKSNSYYRFTPLFDNKIFVTSEDEDKTRFPT
jgi:hypothetical protein